MKVFNRKKLLIAVSMAFFATGCQSMMHGMGMLPMGSSEDIADSKALWKVLEEEQLVGENRKKVKPYTGQHPHGAILEMLHKKVTVNRGEKIELYDYEFDIYNNPVVKEFLESNN